MLYLCGLKTHAMNSEKFAEITAQCQPHEVFSNDWTTFYPDDFADTLLPDAGIIKGKNLRFYDGAGIVPTTGSFPQHYMKLSTNDQIVSLIFFSYPKGVTAGKKADGIRPGHDELCAFFEIEKNDSINVRLKAGADFKKILHSIAADDHSKDISKNIDTLEFETSLSKFQAFFKPEISHYAMLSFVGFITGADLVKKHNKTVPGIKLHDLEAYTSEPADNKKRKVKEEQRLQLKIGFTVTNTAIHHCVLTVTRKGEVIHCSTYLSAVTGTGQKASDAHVTALQNELKEVKSGTLPAKEEILPPDDYYLYWDCTDFISQRKEMGELVITMAVVTADGNSVTKTYSKITSKEFFQNVKENNYIIILDANDEEVQVFGASIIDRQTRFIKRIAEIYDTLSDKHKLILHLPEIMVKLGWLHGALCQIHWLEGSKATLKFPYEFFMSEERVENVDTLKLKEYFKKKMFLTKNDRIDFLYHNPDLSQLTMGGETGALSELLLQCGVLYNEAHPKVRESLTLFRENLALRETDGPVGDFLKLYKEIREYEEVQKNPDMEKEYINETFFQSFELGSEIDLDNVGSALGKYSLRCYYTGYLHKNTPSSEWILDIEKVQCRFFDSFNFIDDKTKLNPKTWISQPLGCWKFDTEDVKEPLPKAFWPNWYSLSNKDFRELQNILHSKVSNSCNDFFIRSNLKTFDDEYIKKSIQIR